MEQGSMKALLLPSNSGSWMGGEGGLPVVLKGFASPQLRCYHTSSRDIYSVFFFPLYAVRPPELQLITTGHIVRGAIGTWLWAN